MLNIYKENIEAYQKESDCSIKDTKSGKEFPAILSHLKIKSDVVSGLSLCVVNKNPIIESPCSLIETPQREKAWLLVYNYLLTGYLDIDPLLIHEIDFIADAWLMSFLLQHIRTFVDKSTSLDLMKIDQSWLFTQFASRHTDLVLRKFMESDYKRNHYFHPAPFYNLCQWINLKHITKNIIFDLKKWPCYSSTCLRGDTKEVLSLNSDSHVPSLTMVFPLGVRIKPTEIKLFANPKTADIEVYEIDHKCNRISTTEKKVIRSMDTLSSPLIQYASNHPYQGLEFVCKMGSILVSNLWVNGEISFDKDLLF
jgi:hypothetical protein